MPQLPFYNPWSEPVFSEPPKPPAPVGFLDSLANFLNQTPPRMATMEDRTPGINRPPQRGMIDEVGTALMVPQSPLDFGLMALGGPFGKAIKTGAVAAGAALEPSAAEAGGGGLLTKLFNGIRAYHGSPHDFDKFDINKIGTGEGAQAYGHGLYFAENEGVARSYKAAGQPNYLGADRIDAAKRLLADAGGDRAVALNLANERMKGTTKYSEGKLWQDVVNNFDDLVGKEPGKMYEVNINADPSKFLDWDKGGKKTYNDVIDSLPRGLPPLQYPVMASEKLREAGVPGIKYFDAGSRGVTDGATRNYVTFDDKLIDILRKYGIAGLPAAGVAYGAANQGPQGPTVY